MSDDKEKKACCEGSEIMRGFKFGFGLFLAFLAGFLIVDLIAIVIYLIAKAAGFNF
jgi:type III secretory pathway component EscR